MSRIGYTFNCMYTLPLVPQPIGLIALKSLQNVLKIFSSIQRTDMFEWSLSKDGWVH